jgi:acetyl esterase
MPLDPQFEKMLQRMNSMPGFSMDSLTPQALRSMMNQGANFPRKVEKVKKVEDRILPLEGREIPIRVYTPEGEAPYPALVYYHGGGFVIGDLNISDSICRNLANAAGCVVISVDYRLAPEHKFPAAVEDAYDSVQWIASHAEEFDIDPNRIAVGGDSAGANLSTVACIIAKERNTPHIVYQLLIYPGTGYEGEEPPSMRENAKGYLLSVDMLKWFHKHYLPDGQERNPYAYPILYSDVSGLPPAMIVTAEYDPLRDQGKAYADKLQKNGVEVLYKNEEGLIHGFANYHMFVKKAQESLDEMAAQLRRVFAG